MAKIRPDFSFEREGRPLSAWMLDLVADEASTRLKAGEVIQAMSHGFPDVHADLSDLDWEEHGRIDAQDERLRQAVREAVDTPDFPRTEFVQRVIAHRIVVTHDWLDRCTRASAQLDKEPEERLKRLVLRMQAAGDDEERAQAGRRFARWLCASIDRDSKAQEDIYAGSEAMNSAGVSSAFVFGSLGSALLADRDGLRAMLEDEATEREAVDALERIGPAAASFASELLARLDAKADRHGFDGSRPLGSIGREEPGVVDALLERLRSGSRSVRVGAAECMAWAGPPLAGRLDAAIGLLREATQEPDVNLAAIEALASLGRDREDVLNQILELAAPRPPRWIDSEDAFGGRYDAVQYERGVALDALRHFRGFASRVVPALVAALDSFDEYDPDRGYRGEHSRICEALAAFGPEAAPALPRLLGFLEACLRAPVEDRTPPSDVFEVLAAIGPAAAETLPMLETLRREGYDDEEPRPFDRNDPLDAAILTLRGESETESRSPGEAN
ncbi:hypothetical protein [Paludisphaera soli]|uniref:hypothetical protein n=1 Tax=Paludisphaera soli TaxID=2712865 RepID=UPI0013EE2733|nr:hypothetical protein [Paludisphaera soli]